MSVNNIEIFVRKYKLAKQRVGELQEELKAMEGLSDVQKAAFSTKCHSVLGSILAVNYEDMMVLLLRNLQVAEREVGSLEVVMSNVMDAIGECVNEP